MNLRAAARFLPDWKNIVLAVLASVLLILAFPPFELWFTAWFALVPLLWAIERERFGPSFVHSRLVVRQHLLLRYLLVADLRPDHLRRLSGHRSLICCCFA